MIKLGVRVYGLGGVALGLVGLAFGDFASVWQPVPKDVPERTALAYLVAALLLALGLAVNWKRTARIGAAGLAGLYALGVVALHVPIAVAQPLELESWAGIAEQMALVAGGIVSFTVVSDTADAKTADRIALAGRIIFGVCLLVFGAVHFVYLRATASYVPQYLPLGGVFWANFTGAAHVAAGLGILSGVRARLAAQLVTAMFVVFGLLVHAPTLLAASTNHVAWAANAINLALIGAAWAVASSLEKRP